MKCAWVWPVGVVLLTDGGGRLLVVRSMLQ